MACFGTLDLPHLFINRLPLDDLAVLQLGDLPSRFLPLLDELGLGFPLVFHRSLPPALEGAEA